MISVLTEKLNYKSGLKAAFINIPENMDFCGISTGNQLDAYDFILAFFLNQTEAKKELPAMLKACTPHAIIWVAYPKKSSSISTDLSRDSGWESFKRSGYRPVSLVSLNEDWSALRFKPVGQVKSRAKAKTHVFEATIEEGTDHTGGTWVKIPYNVGNVYCTQSQVKVKATIDDYPYQGSLVNMGNGHMLIILKEIRQALNKFPGDKVKVTLQEDKTERTVVVPEELQQLLKENDQARSFYNALSFTNRKEYAYWISSAKKAETKKRRLNETLQKLNNGLKNPNKK